MENRLAEYRIKAGLSQAGLGRKIGLTGAAISLYEKGRRQIGWDMAVRLAEVLDCSPSEIFGEEGPQIAEDYISFDIVGEIAAGYNHVANVKYDGRIDIPKSWLRGRSREEFIVFRVSGQSMFPTYQEGDLVLVLRQPELDYSGQVAVVRYNDEFGTLKRVERGKDFVRLVPINPQYPPETIRGEELSHCEVVGIPKMLIRGLD